MKMKEIHQNSLHHYAEELLTMNMLETQNEEPNMETILVNAFTKLDRDITIEALPVSCFKSTISFHLFISFIL